MKLVDLFEAVDVSLFDLVKSFGLSINKAGTSIDDFDFTEDHNDAFRKIGYELVYNAKKNNFSVIKIKSTTEKEREEGELLFQMNDISGRKVGFKPPRKQK